MTLAEAAAFNANRVIQLREEADNAELAGQLARAWLLRSSANDLVREVRQ